MIFWVCVRVLFFHLFLVFIIFSTCCATVTRTLSFMCLLLVCTSSIPGNYQCVCYNFVSFISRISTASSCLISNVGCYRSYRRTTTTTTTTTEPPQTYKDELTAKSGLSTFGIIAIIFTIIVFALAFYYGVMCYPLLCRNDKKYRFMDVSSTITAATSRSIQSIENYPVDQKHHHQLA